MSGWEPTEYTESRYDDAGLLTGTVASREPEWDDEQRDLALAFAEFMRGMGPNGEQLSEATSSKADPNYYKADQIRYVSAGPFTNWAEKRRLDAIDAYKSVAGDNSNLNGMFWTVEKAD